VAGITIAAIAPHGGIAVAELCADGELELALATRAGLEELGRRFAAASPDAAFVLTPHNVHIEGSFAIIVAGSLEGTVREDTRTIELTCPVDVDLALGALRGLAAAGLPVTGVSYGGNRPAEATMPMDWGATIPLWYMGGRNDPPLPVVLLSPARELSPEAHVEAGRALARVAEDAGKHVALIASADHGHGHDASGPYGFSPASGPYDELVVRLIAENRLDELTAIEPSFVEEAQADSWWQMLVLHGATEDRFEPELISYEAPTYFGMACASFTPRASAA